MMSIGTKIFLPLWSSSKHVCDVIAKVIGVEFEIKQFDSVSYSINSDLPSQKDNAWFHVFSSDIKNQTFLKLEANHFFSDMLDINFKGLSGERHQWHFFNETEYEDCKLLNPSSSALAIAIGIRLIKFFGGYIQFNDCDEKINLKVPNSKAIFPKKTKSQTSDDRWYQFQNALYHEPLLTTKELLFALKNCSYNTISSEKMLEKLTIIESREDLNKKLPDASKIKTKPRL